jgi:uncharacterized protein YjgD (DUF1641 family)
VDPAASSSVRANVRQIGVRFGIERFRQSTQVTAERDQPLSVFRLLRRLTNKDSLRALAAALDFLQAFGRQLHSLESQSTQTQ